MSPDRRSAVVVGTFFVLAAVAAVAGLALYQPALSDPGYVLGAGADGQVLLGGLLEVVLAVSCLGTAVAVYPVLRRHAPAAAIGYVAGRLLEAAVICVGIVATLSLVTLRRERDAVGDDGALVAVGHGLVALHDWTFLLGPGLVIGLNSLLLAAAVHRAGLVPRWITVLGLVGGPLVLLSSTAVLFGLYAQVSPVAMAAAVPVAAWEMSLAVYLLVRGYRTVPTAGAGGPAGGRVATPSLVARPA
ncbi:DUF4386 domain-containing protein [Cellulomonas fimi]|uniref:DUF4386 domain-containing protein n=1 Tax=Cellulomonas fimi (strain ATCC 484 / DSM 20113 / JCM 1341 / CCUG 24087 / LMG 16345 / NBRC 15513 / NCIMB 8980 / NCTC 7547 / NRS-133) TaxID=590998 RepID=F4GZ59_CELFA|nr:DUF4386 domain-containing protein [Cellulomonas fimi]AEE47175.1 hypothetical protein Celf_3058 [Cellulomonas fimi ATCC 484]NNH08995.1 DUF4386 domain-containing protein [Cellulomonas fimi]VEH35490.1 Uncharacterised protein [Cellulomonas fimi]